MSFLSVTFLFALPLIAAPLLLHLFDRRRNVEIQWGAMSFLIAAANQKTNARRFKQWLLLLLRMLAIAALVLALARPLVPGGWLGGETRQETILIVDNSMSMSRAGQGSSFMDRAKERAIEEIAKMAPGDRVRLMTTAPYPVWSQAGSLRADEVHHDVIIHEIESMSPTQGRSDLLAAVLNAANAQPGPLVTRRRLVVLSDGQSGDLHLDDQVGWDRFRHSIQSARVPTEVKVILIDSDSGQKGNVAVDEITANRLLVGVDQVVDLAAKIHNHGELGSRPIQAIWSTENDTLAASQSSPLAPGQSELIHWKGSFDRPGVYRVSCQIEHRDDLTDDNHASVVVEVVEEIPILIVEAQPDRVLAQQDSFFVQAALGWIDGTESEAGAVHVPTIVSVEDFSRQPLDSYRCIVIASLTDLDDESLQRLKEFVYSGGGLWVAVGPRTNLDRFNAHWFAGGNGLSPLAIDDIVDEQSLTDEFDPNPDESIEPARINPFGSEHPATAVLADNERLDLGDVTVNRRAKFVDSTHQAAEAASSVLLSLSNGQPLAVEKLYGRGRVITSAIPLTMQWSGLATAEAFVVMVRDWADYLSQPKSTQFNLKPGDNLVYQTTDDQASEARLSIPNGEYVELTTDMTTGHPLFRTSRTRLPGSYALQIGLADQPLPFEVHRDPAESDLTPLTDADRTSLRQLAGLKSTGVGSTLSGNSQTDPLWPLLLMTLIAVMAGELVLSGVLARERFGSVGIELATEPLADGRAGVSAASPNRRAAS